MSRRTYIIIIVLLIIVAIGAIAFPWLMKTDLFLDHATASIARYPDISPQPCLSITGPAGWTVIDYNIVLDGEHKPQIGGKGRGELGLFDNERKTCVSYFPDSMAARDLPLETHIRLVPGGSPAAAVTLPTTAEQEALVGTWIIVTKNPEIYARLADVAPALRAP